MNFDEIIKKTINLENTYHDGMCITVEECKQVMAALAQELNVVRYFKVEYYLHSASRNMNKTIKATNEDTARAEFEMNTGNSTIISIEEYPN